MFAKTNRRNAAADAGYVDAAFIIGGAFLAVLAALIIGVVIFIVVSIANTPSAGRIAAKHFTPAYTTTQCSLVGKVNVCTPVHHGDSW